MKSPTIDFRYWTGYHHNILDSFSQKLCENWFLDAPMYPPMFTSQSCKINSKLLAFISEALLSQPEIGNCTNKLDKYMDMITTLENLQNMMKQDLSVFDSEYIISSILSFLDKLYNLNTVEAVEEDCYWFDR